VVAQRNQNQDGFAQKVFEIALAKERFPRKGAKPQRKLLKRGSALRLCVRKSAQGSRTFCAKPTRTVLLSQSS
jgi:hypothetical protein